MGSESILFGCYKKTLWYMVAGVTWWDLVSSLEVERMCGVSELLLLCPD